MRIIYSFFLVLRIFYYYCVNKNQIKNIYDIIFFKGGRNRMMKKVLKFLSVFVLVVAEFAANTPSQLGSYQMDAPKQLKK